MIKGMHQTARSLYAHIKNMEIVSQNLANINTTGYKRELPFSELVNRFKDDRYKQVSDFTNGAMIETGNRFDVALSKKGFFLVDSENGPALTRNGNFTVDREGFLVDRKGNYVLGYNGKVYVKDFLKDETADITIHTNGEIKIDGELRDQLIIADIDDQEKLLRSSSGHFYTESREYKYLAEDEYIISQGFLEESNVNSILEMQEMITLSKDYEAAQKMIRNYDDVLGRTNEIGKV